VRVTQKLTPVVLLSAVIACSNQTATDLGRCVDRWLCGGTRAHVQWFDRVKSNVIPFDYDAVPFVSAVAQLTSAPPDFSLSATPFLQAATPGNTASYSIAVAPVISATGFFSDIVLRACRCFLRKV